MSRPPTKRKNGKPTLLKAEDVGPLLGVGFSIVARLVEEKRLTPAHPGRTIYSHRFTRRQVLAFAKKNGTGSALYKPGHAEIYTPPDTDWEKSGRRPLDHEYLLDRTQFHDLKHFFPLAELIPALDDALTELRPPRAFVVQGRLRGFSFRELGDMVDRKAGTLKTAFNEAVSDMNYSRALARLRLVLNRFASRHLCRYAYRYDHDLPCLHCGLSLVEYADRLRTVRPRWRGPAPRDTDPDLLRAAILCDGRPAPPDRLSVFDFATPDQFASLDFPFKSSGLDARTIAALAAHGYTHLGHAYHRIDFGVEHDISLLVDKGVAPRKAFAHVLDLFVSLGLAAPGEFPTLQERNRADMEYIRARIAAARTPHPAFVARDDQDEFAYLDRPIEDLDLSVRTYRGLKNAGVGTIRGLLRRSESELLSAADFGKRALIEIKDILHPLGLGLGMDFDDEGHPVPGSGTAADHDEDDDEYEL